MDYLKKKVLLHDHKMKIPVKDDFCYMNKITLEVTQYCYKIPQNPVDFRDIKEAHGIAQTPISGLHKPENRTAPWPELGTVSLLAYWSKDLRRAEPNLC